MNTVLPETVVHVIFALCPMKTATMNPPLRHTEMSALAYLHDHVRDLPEWFRRLTVRQFEDIAEVMVQWNISCENHGTLPMEEIEKREVLRVLAICQGKIPKAAKLLQMGKTTIYRKLTNWGYSVQKQKVDRTSVNTIRKQANNGPERSSRSRCACRSGACGSAG